MYLKSIYIASTESRAGRLIIAIGLMEMLKARYGRVAFFCPILSNEGEESDIDFMLQHFKLDMIYAQCCGFRASEYIKAHADGTLDTLYESLIEKVSLLHQSYDFVLIEGAPRTLFAATVDFDINLHIAKNLGSAFAPVINAKNKALDEIINETKITNEAVASSGCTQLATFINRCETETLEDLQNHFKDHKDTYIYLLPEVSDLNTPTLQLIRKHLHAKMVLGRPEQLEYIVKGNKIAAMGIENYLMHLENSDLVIVPGDRIDIITASLISFYAKNHPSIAGIVLSGGILPSEAMMRLLMNFSETVVPVLSVDLDSYETAVALENVYVKIGADSSRQITLAKGIFDAAVNKQMLSERFHINVSDMMTPMMFQYRIFEQAGRERKKIVLPESTDERILRATDMVLRRNIVDIILLGENHLIEHASQQLGLDIRGAVVIDPKDPELLESFSQTLYTLRRAKGLTLEAARDAVTDINYFATMMVYSGMADGMVSGAVHTTTETVRPALQIIKQKPGLSIISSIFFMCLDNKVLVYGDCAINLDPSADELAQIAVASADTAARFGIEPRVAMLSYSTGDSGSGPEVEKVREATRLAQSLRPDLPIVGPIQYDAAIDVQVAHQKLPESKIAGNATVFIFPDLNTGNNTYKAVERSSDVLAIGPILQGLRKPVNDLSRGSEVEEIVNTIAITAIQAQEGNA